MRFEWYLAARYFKGRRHQSRFLSFIKIMAITGVTIGAGGLLIALSIVHGFKSNIYNKVLSFGPHIEVMKMGPSPIFRADTLERYLNSYPEVSEAQAIVEGQGMIQYGDNVEGTFFKGVPRSGDLSSLNTFIEQGSYRLGTDSTGLPGMVIGQKLASNLAADVGDRITSYAIEGMPSPMNTPEIQQFRISGIYDTGISEFDDALVLIERKYARKLFGVQGVQATKIDLNLKDQNRIQQFDRQLNASLQFPYHTQNIYERHSSIFAWVNLQEETIPFVILAMIIVAAFNLIGTVLMMVLERTRDIGILKTMGAKAKSIRRVFLLEGLIVAVVGLFNGTLLSLIFYWLQSQYQIIPLSEENYYMSHAPVEPHGLDFLIVSAVTILLCTLASYWPARVAAKLNAVRIITFGR